MPALSITLQVSSLNEAMTKLGEIKDVISDLTPEWTLVGEYLIDFEEQDVFETEGNVFNESWAPLSEAYQIWKSKNYPGRGILEASGTLRYAFESLPSADYLILSNPTPYGGYLEYGTANLPARVFLKLDDERLRIIRQMIIDSLENRIFS